MAFHSFPNVSSNSHSNNIRFIIIKLQSTIRTSSMESTCSSHIDVLYYQLSTDALETIGTSGNRVRATTLYSSAPVASPGAVGTLTSAIPNTSTISNTATAFLKSKFAGQWHRAIIICVFIYYYYYIFALLIKIYLQFKSVQNIEFERQLCG